MAHTGKVISGNRITIPEEWLNDLHMKEGDVVILELKTNPFGLLIRPADVIPKDDMT